MSEEFLNSESSLFYQKSPTDAWTHLDELALTDFVLSGREAGSPYEVSDVGERGAFRIKGYLPGGLVNPGFSAQRPWQLINYLWKLTNEGLVNFRLNVAKTGVENDPENYTSALIFVGGEVTNPALDGGKAMQSGDAARNMTTMQTQAREGYELQKLSNNTRLTTAVTELGTGIFFAKAIKSGYLRRRTGQHGIITLEAGGAATPDVLRTLDYGVTWTVGSTDPFIADMHCLAPLIVDLPQERKYRVIVFNGVTQGGETSECAYADVVPGTTAWAAAWTNVDIGGTVAWFITAAFKVHDGLILAGDDQGNVYYSTNKAVTWTIASYGGSSDVRGFALAPDGTLWACGDGTEVYYSEDDGRTWTAVSTAPAGAVTSIAVNHENYVFIIDNVTLLKYSADKGNSWVAVTVTAEAVTALKDIRFDPFDFTGVIIVDDAGSDDRIHRTEDGGMSWIAQTTGTSNTGLNNLHLADENLVYMVGDVVSTTWIEKLFGTGSGS